LIHERRVDGLVRARHCCAQVKEIGMRVVRAIVAMIGMAALAACGSSKEPTASPEATQPGEAVVESVGPPIAFAQCISCHSVKPGVNGVGPSLHGVVGRKAASLPGYAYSEPLKNSGLTWDDATLDKWLAAPKWCPIQKWSSLE
jgi:cytochrome c